MKEYIVNLCKSIPEEIIEGCLSILCLTLVIIIAIKGLKKGWRLISKVILAEYVFLIFCSTVLFRVYKDNIEYNFTLFWSYSAIQEGREDIPYEILLNVLFFVPLGLLFGMAFKEINWWKVLVACLCISSSIEILQLVLNRGFAELDDIFHNVLGSMIGYSSYAMVKYVYERRTSYKFMR